MKLLPNHLDRSRFGFLVGKRLGNAVARNKVKRRLKEAIRQTPPKPGWDIVFIARREAANGDYHQLRQAAEDLLRKAGLLDSPAIPEPPAERRLPHHPREDVQDRGARVGSDERSDSAGAGE